MKNHDFLIENIFFLHVTYAILNCSIVGFRKFILFVCIVITCSYPVNNKYKQFMKKFDVENVYKVK